MNEISPFVTSSAPYLTAFLAGLLGGVHCIGMCGGVVGALSLSGGQASMMRLLAYNAGRISTYVMLGIAIGAAGQLAGDLLVEYRAWSVLRIVAGLFMIAMGLYLARWWFGLTVIERGGARIWALMRPLSARFLPVRNSAQAWLAGLVWGWLPCGLVYTTLVWSLAAGGWLQGAGFMLAFGLGTLPTLMFAGMAWAKAGPKLAELRTWAGVLVIGFGLWTVFSTLWMGTNVGLGCAVPPAAG